MPHGPRPARSRLPSPVSRLLLAACALLAGCATTRDPGPRVDDDVARAVQQLQLWHRGTAAFKVDLLARLKPEGRDAMTFTISAWRPTDGRLRLEASKVGFSGFEALVQTDGAFTAVTREREVVVDDLEAVFAENLGPGAAVVRLADEIALGPLPAATDWRREGTAWAATDPATGHTVLLTPGPGQEIAAKTYRDAGGAEVLRLEYSRYKVFEGLNRPSVIRIVLPGRPGDYLLRIQTLDQVPSVSDARMRLTPPPGTRLTFQDFLRRLGE